MCIYLILTGDLSPHCVDFLLEFDGTLVLDALKEVQGIFGRSVTVLDQFPGAVCSEYAMGIQTGKVGVVCHALSMSQSYFLDTYYWGMHSI